MEAPPSGSKFTRSAPPLSTDLLACLAAPKGPAGFHASHHRTTAPAPPPLPPAAMAKDDVDFEGLELIEMRLEIDVPKLIQVPLTATLPDTFRAPTFRTRRVHAAAHSAGAALFQR